ncbi:MAG: SDR family NAD(P)-dependent oxidoreductase [Chloroflexi bacterium]|nr:SDR family NAD(P)-dependent oxidoreductase [Chloroflexota bacterium]
MDQHVERIVVTGGAGFIGSHLVDRLLADSAAEVLVLDNLRRGRLGNLARHQAEPRLRLIQADVRDADAVAAALRGASAVYHLAAESTVTGAASDVDYAFTTNVVGTFNVLRAATRCGVPRLIFASSREVYGEPIALPVEEGQPLAPLNAYGASKAVGEMYCRVFRRMFGLQAIILRLANVYGPRDFGRVIPLWLERARAGQDLHVYGGKQVLDFLWIGQTVEAFVQAGALDEPLPPINVGSGTGTRILELAQRIVCISGSEARIRLLPARKDEVTRFVANVDRMGQLLGLHPPLDPLASLPNLLPAALDVAS